MLQETLDAFEKKLAKNKNVVVDTYIVKDGTYRLIEMGPTEWKIKKTVDIYYDKKSRELIGMNDEDFHLIRQLDYYSKLLEMNKPIDPKKIIHTNNYLSIAVKKENVVSSKFDNDIIKNYYQILKNPMSKYDKKAKSKRLYAKVEENLERIDMNLLEEIEEYILEHNVFEEMDLSKKNYAKVFFIFPDEEKTLYYYENESMRYFLPNLYNSNDYNIDVQGDILGLPNNNMGMNTKKPFLESKTRKVVVPYLLDQKKALLQSQLFDYLWGKVSQGKYDFYIITDDGNEDIKLLDEMNESASGYYIRCQKEKNEVKIVHADIVTDYSKKLNEPFVLQNYLDLSENLIDNSQLDYNCYIDDIWQVCDLIDNVFFQRKLKYNFYLEANDIQLNDSLLKRCLLENRDALLRWFYTGEVYSLKSVIDKFSFELILNSINHNEIYKAQNQLNLRWSLFAYFDKKGSIGENMIEVREKLRKHINSSYQDEWDFENDEEFAYAVGQLAYYITMLNKSNNKSHAFINRYLNANNSEVLKKKIMINYKKYNYLISYNSKRVSELLSHIMTYNPQDIKDEYIVAGYTAGSLILEKRQEESEDE